ncbi:MAG: hypothetical protein IPM32_18490 [Ignavibacteriae bacterium]|nr:hypothetical protein [Ignavibacteriota bacterium]
MLIINLHEKLNAQWETQESRVTVDLIDVCFVDSLNGWVIEIVQLYLPTNDGGENWKLEKIEEEIGFKKYFL